MAETPPDKVCNTCGRAFGWRRKWAANWSDVKYCSERCRRQRLSVQDRALEAAILSTLQTRAGGATMCPSEAARIVFDDAAWRTEMERTQSAARRLVARGEIVIVQGGRVVDPSGAKGPIRLRLA